MYEPHIARLITLCTTRPDHVVVTDTRTGDHLTAAEFLSRVRKTATALAALGVTEGDRVVIGLHPGRLLVETAYGCFFLGAVPAFLDPTTEPAALSTCLEELQPAVVLADTPIAGVSTISSAELTQSTEAALMAVAGADRYTVESIVMLMYTSGTTGLPKGAVWSWDNCDSQLHYYEKRDAASEFILFPMSAFNAVALGCRAILPDFATFAPRSVDLLHLIAQVDAYPADYMFGSPELWRRYLAHTSAGGRGFTHPPSLIATAGAAVGSGLVAALGGEFGDSTILIPYAATEGLMPLTMITGAGFLEQTAVWPIAEYGIPLGSTCCDVRVAIIPPGRAFGDEPASDQDFLPEGEVGEIVISGRRRSPSYYRRSDANAYAKFRDSRGTLWHRMGDIGHVRGDAVWLRCRKKDLMALPSGDRVYPDQIEQSINDAVGSETCAAVVASGRLTVVFPSTDPVTTRGESALTSAVHALGIAARIAVVEGPLPVDARHNSKINRAALADALTSRKAPCARPSEPQHSQ